MVGAGCNKKRERLVSYGGEATGLWRMRAERKRDRVRQREGEREKERESKSEKRMGQDI